MDEYFRNILPFTNLKLFGHYNKVVQWTENKQRAIVKQLIIVATPLLIQDAPKAIYYICTILNFTMLVQYLLHNNKTLLYMDYAFSRLEKTQIAFENFCLIEKKLF